MLGVLVGKEDGVVGTSNLLEMVPGVLEGQTSRGLFQNSIFDPSMIGASIEPNFTPESWVGVSLSQMGQTSILNSHKQNL